MSSKTLFIATDWSAEEAGRVLRFLDDLKDSIWETYGEDIVAECERQFALPLDDGCSADERSAREELHNDPFNDEIPF